MRPSVLLFTLFRILLLPALIGTTYLYLYPVFQQCSFAAAAHDGRPAPFRLLALGDPQLEGDTSVPQGPGAAADLGTLWQRDGWPGVGRGVAWALKRRHKQLDLWGNDRYLAHIRRGVMWWSEPTHVAVLGDLLGSQWISDDEFERRGRRFWDVVFRGGEKVSEEVMDGTKTAGWEVLGADWKRRIIAIAGNHDIGYAGDIDRRRVERFERAFGRVNWEVRFRLDDAGGQTDTWEAQGASSAPPPELRLVILNSMNLDEPAYEADLRAESWAFLREHLGRAVPNTTATLLLTHIPLHKRDPICADTEYFSYFPAEQGGGVKEQNFLSRDASTEILDGLVGERDDQTALVLNGHDHVGCDTLHSRARRTWDDDDDDGAVSGGDGAWAAVRTPAHPTATRQTAVVGVREVTVRSMMGDFAGSAGFLSAWWDGAASEWRFEYRSCRLGVQHVWWAVHATALVTGTCGVAGLLAMAVEVLVAGATTKVKTL